MGKLTTTHTYAELEISGAAYDEIYNKLRDADYQHAFMENGVIDMHGIGIAREQKRVTVANVSTRAEIVGDADC